MTASITESHRQSATTNRIGGSAHHTVRTVPAAEMARMKRATRRDLAYMRKHPVTNPWLDIAIRAERAKDPVHWPRGPVGKRAHVGSTPNGRRTHEATSPPTGRDPQVRPIFLRPLTHGRPCST